MAIFTRNGLTIEITLDALEAEVLDAVMACMSDTTEANLARYVGVWACENHPWLVRDLANQVAEALAERKDTMALAVRLKRAKAIEPRVDRSGLAEKPSPG